jgi:hypothetical protein
MIVYCCDDPFDNINPPALGFQSPPAISWVPEEVVFLAFLHASFVIFVLPRISLINRAPPV